MKTILLSIFLSFAFSQTAPQNNNGLIEGDVVRYGTSDGISNVDITLTLEGESTVFRTAFDNAVAYSDTVTDAKGHFVLRNVYPGKYTIRAKRGGWVNPAPNGVRFRDGGTTKSVVVGPKQHVEGANLAMVFGGVIAGRILNPNGDPMVRVGVSVSPLKPEESGSNNGAQTDDHGEFRIYGIEPGTYRISAYGYQEFDTTYFPGVREIERATTLNISENDVRAGVDFRMLTAEKKFKISGKLLGPTVNLSEATFDGVYLVPKGATTPKTATVGSNGGLFATGFYNNVRSHDASPGDFTIQNVRPGDYDLFAEMRNGSICCDIIGKVELHVADRDLDNISIESGGVEVRGQVSVIGSDSPRPAATVSLALLPQDIRTRQVQSDADGTFTISYVLNGSWRVLVSGLSSEWAVSDVRVGEKSVYEGGFTVEDRTPERVQVILSRTGSIDGIVHDAQQRPVAGAQVVFMPIQSDPSNAAWIRRASSDAAGRFSLPSVVAGRYAAVALDRPPDRELNIPVSSGELRTFLLPFETQRTIVDVTAGTAVTIDMTPVN